MRFLSACFCVFPKRVTLLEVESGSDALWRQSEGPAQHLSGNAAVVDDGWVCGEYEILGVAAKLIGDPNQLRLFENCRPRHNGVVSSIGIMFAAQKSSRHFRFSPSARLLTGAVD